MLLCALVAFTMGIWLPLLIIAIIYLANIIIPVAIMIVLVSSVGFTNALLIVIVLALVFWD